MQFRLATYGIDLGLALFLLLSSALFVLAASLSELGFLLFALATTDFLLLLELAELLKNNFSNINLRMSNLLDLFLLKYASLLVVLDLGILLLLVSLLGGQHGLQFHIYDLSFIRQQKYE